MTKHRVTIVTIVMIAALLSGCREATDRLWRQPTVALRNVAVEGIGLNGGSLRVALLVRNPNFYSLSTAGMQYHLLAGDSISVAAGVDSTHRSVPANDSAIVELPVHVSWQGLSAAGRAIADNGLVPYQLVGTITLDTPVGKHDIQVNQRGRFAPLH